MLPSLPVSISHLPTSVLWLVFVLNSAIVTDDMLCKVKTSDFSMSALDIGWRSLQLMQDAFGLGHSLDSFCILHAMILHEGLLYSVKFFGFLFSFVALSCIHVLFALLLFYPAQDLLTCDLIILFGCGKISYYFCLLGLSPIPFINFSFSLLSLSL